MNTDLRIDSSFSTLIKLVSIVFSELGHWVGKIGIGHLHVSHAFGFKFCLLVGRKIEFHLNKSINTRKEYSVLCKDSVYVNLKLGEQFMGSRGRHNYVTGSRCHEPFVHSLVYER